MNRSRRRLAMISQKNTNSFRATANSFYWKLQLGADQTSTFPILKKKKGEKNYQKE